MSLLEDAFAKFDAANCQDPNKETVDGVSLPRELVYARRLTDWVLRLAPDASEPLRLASRCQHLCRWKIPRDFYPKDRVGYLRWREDLKNFHASESGRILKEVGYDDGTIRKVQDLNLKKNFPKDSDSRVLEDALCLIFLEHQLGDLAAEQPEPKMIEIIRRTWRKMSDRGREAALKLRLGAAESALLQKALAASPSV
jgi:hypothetical protein